MLSKSSRTAGALGFGLVEMLVVMVLVCIVAATCVPLLTGLRQHRQLAAAADTLHAEIQHARSEAARLGKTVRLGFSDHPGGTCYIIHIGNTGDCRCKDDGRAACTAGYLLKVEWIDKKSQIVVKANVPVLSFDPDGGYGTSPGTIGLTNAAGENISHIVSFVGRIRSCTTTPGKNSLPKCEIKTKKN